jgi:hypothetical protein
MRASGAAVDAIGGTSPPSRIALKFAGTRPLPELTGVRTARPPMEQPR